MAAKFPKSKRILVCAVCAAAAVTVLAAILVPHTVSAVKKTAVSYSAVSEVLPQNDYDWSALTAADGRLSYSDSRYVSVPGIDVSDHQGEIDWQQVAQDGIEFAMIRAGYRGYQYGLLHTDACFEQNLTGAQAAGLGAGVYFFSEAMTVSEVREEADLVLSLLGGRELQYPVVFDMELQTADDDRSRNLTAAERTELALVFCEAMRSAGYTPMIYGNTAWLTDYYLTKDILQVDLWLADYTGRPSFPNPFRIWQYSCTGSVQGVPTDVDLDLLFREK